MTCSSSARNAPNGIKPGTLQGGNMPNIIETAKAATVAYNDKNWDKVKAAFAENSVYDEKGTGRRLQGVKQIIEDWQGWGKAIPESKETIVAETAYGD